MSTETVGVPEKVTVELGKPLDPKRVRTKPGGRGLSYLATHDCIRVANAIFGYGRWGHEVLELVHLGTEQFTKDGKTGVIVGYRCTVRLTVAGCVPVCGVGYGDGQEYTPTAKVTAHELAMKEAESDALKRALKNFGDQFGLILYAKPDESRRIEAERPPEGASTDRIEALREALLAEGLDVELIEGAFEKRKEANGGVLPVEYVEKELAASLARQRAKEAA